MRAGVLAEVRPCHLCGGRTYGLHPESLRMRCPKCGVTMVADQMLPYVPAFAEDDIVELIDSLIAMRSRAEHRPGSKEAERQRGELNGLAMVRTAIKGGTDGA